MTLFAHDPNVAALNFASGVMPGGGVRFGAMAQEEALCLSSGLLHELEDNLGYYEANRTKGAPPEPRPTPLV